MCAHHRRDELEAGFAVVLVISLFNSSATFPSFAVVSDVDFAVVSDVDIDTTVFRAIIKTLSRNKMTTAE